MLMVECNALKDQNDKLIGLKVKVFDVDKSKLLRKTKLIIGDNVVIDPLEPSKEKNRNRVGRVMGYYFDDLKNVEAVKVKFDDTNRIGKVEIDDLVPYHI